MDKGTLFIISAPSGAGKSSLIRNVLKKRENTFFSISYTTRAPRGRERHGKDYFFIDEAKFFEMIEQNLFLEYAKVHDFYYGTEKTFILNNLDKGNDIILDIDYQGAKLVKENLKNSDYNITTIFIMPPSFNELKKRLEKRGTDSQQVIEKRLQNAIIEMENSFFYDYIIINDIFKRAFYDLLAIFRANSIRTINIKNKVNELIKKYKEDLYGTSNN